MCVGVTAILAGAACFSEALRAAVRLRLIEERLREVVPTYNGLVEAGFLYAGSIHVHAKTLAWTHGDEQLILILRISVFGSSSITLCIEARDAENTHLFRPDAHERIEGPISERGL
jgi:hypothetical protein